MKQLNKFLLPGGAVLLLAIVLLISCYPGDPLTVSETDAVVTLFDKNTDFSTKLTYAMPDTVMHLVGEGGKDDVSRAYDQLILTQIHSNLDKLGFTRVSDPNTADVQVYTAAVVQDYVGYAYYGWYWDYWYGYPPGWGWYPWYPSGGVAYSYRVGTLLVVMMDPHKTVPDQKLVPPVWSAAMNGLADKASNSQRIKNGINQAFAQSKYLGEGK
ncbi:MAG TPA: DUF4136 domain-containing protein [Candidatus Krumholzibacteria bacterium]|nr:DUF4136 domain-containing protein [Candidatus Krumholzibacteria bacterium]